MAGRVEQLMRSVKELTVLLMLTAGPLLSVSVSADELLFKSGNQQTTLLELFTSEGCSSCPPAEKWMASLKNNPSLWSGIVPISYHVDYWNYLGWRDPFSNKQWSQRQRQYRYSGGLSSVYTPGFVANGEEWRGWFGSRNLPLPDNQPGQLSVRINDGDLSAEYVSTGLNHADRQLHVAILGFGIESTVTAGENSGKHLTHDFVVLHQTDASSADNKWQLQLPRVDQPQAKRLGLAAWVTEAGQMPPMQATGGWLD